MLNRYQSKYKIERRHWWKFWKIDKLIIILDSSFHDPYDLLKKDGKVWSSTMKDYVVKYLRKEVSDRVKEIQKIVSKSSETFVEIKVGNYTTYPVLIKFYIVDDSIYFEFEKHTKRNKALDDLGIK